MRSVYFGLIFCAGLAGCEPAAPHALRYHGELAGCGGPATLTRDGTAIAFAPQDGALVLRGQVAPDGRFSASLNTQPPGKPPFLLQVDGDLDDASAQIRYRTPRCQGSSTLARVRRGLFD